MITYKRTTWYGFEYLVRMRGSLLPRALPAMIVAGTIAFLMSAGVLDPYFGWELTTFFDDPFGMQMFGVVRSQGHSKRATHSTHQWAWQWTAMAAEE